ncbi:MAG: uroporphyrinogen-III synthase, partial [Acidobacteriota bacterium]
DRLSWFEKLPLFGQRIVVTRDRRQSRDLAEPLEELGAEVVALPVIEICPPADRGPLDGAVANLDSYDWIIFTSVNGVRSFVAALDASAGDLRKVRAKIAAIGPATRDAVEALHLKVDKMPAEYVAESLVEAFADEDLAGKRVLLPRAAVARDVVPVELGKRGALVDVVDAYRTEAPLDIEGRAKDVLKRGADWITFTSSSTVRNFVEAVGAPALEWVRVASIGPVTSATARELGLTVTVEANPHTVAGLVDAIRLHGLG